MSITTTVSKTAVKGSENFSYEITFSFSGLSSGAREGSISILFPPSINRTSPLVGENEVVKAVTYRVQEDDSILATYDLGTVTSGTSGSFNFFASFGGGRSDGETFTAKPVLLADDTPIEISTAPTVTLSLTKNFKLRKYFSSQNAYRAGDELTMTIVLSNAGDAGALIENVSIEDVLPAGLEPVTDFTPIGEDSTSSEFYDFTYQDREGTWTGNTLNFTLPSFRGKSYAITSKVRIADDVTEGEKITNTATWTENGAKQEDATAFFFIFKEVPGVWVAKNAPKYTVAGADFRYSILLRNSGTISLDTTALEDALPPEVDIDRLSFHSLATGTFDISIITSADESALIPVVTGGTDYVENMDLKEFIPTGARVTKLLIAENDVPPNSASASLYLFGKTSEAVMDGDVISNLLTYAGTNKIKDVKASATASTTVENTSYLSIRQTAGPKVNVQPLDEVDISLSANADSGDIIEPIFVDYLPEGLEYEMGSEVFSYYDRKTNKIYSTENGDFPSDIPLPQAEILRDFEGTGRTLVRFPFVGYTLPYLDTLYVAFKAIVSLSPPAEFSNVAYLGSPGKTSFVASPVTDALDLDGDDITAEKIAQSNTLDFTALSSSIFNLQKTVKGALDAEFSSLGNTTAGGSAQYQLLVSNSFDRDLTDIHLVDILPHVGDTGVILDDAARYSDYKVIANSAPTITLMNLLGDATDDVSKLTIEYSESDNPLRFDDTGGEIGEDDDWSPVLPSPISEIRAFRVKTGTDFVLHPYDRLSVTWDVLTPVSAELGDIAYNSFAADAVKIKPDGNSQLLPTEPKKAGLRVDRSDTATVGATVFLDANRNGLFDDEEVGENAVTVSLYDESDTLIQSTVTDFDPFTGEAGHYLFTEVAPGNYYLQFLAPEALAFTTAGGDSKADEETGKTELFTLSAGDAKLDLNAGLVLDVCQEAPTIQAKPYCIYVGSDFDPLLGVSATNCDGTEIPLTEENILRNDVDVTKAGAYQITYTVTSPVNGMSKDRTITITVVALPPYYESYTQIIESVALEESAISGILQAEAAKIKKAEELGFSAQELLAVNASVDSMVKAITALEMILKCKVDLAMELALPSLDNKAQEG